MFDSVIEFCKDHYILVLVAFAFLVKQYSSRKNAKILQELEKDSLVLKVQSDADWVSFAKAAEGKYILVDFFATWCGPCVSAAPIFIRMSQELKNNKNIELWKVDVDGKHNIAKSQRISAMPTFKMYKAENGSLREVEMVQGFSEPKMRDLVAKYAK